MTDIAGVWITAGTNWGYEGPGSVTPYSTELEAFRAANTDMFLKAWFVPFGKDLREVMA